MPLAHFHSCHHSSRSAKSTSRTTTTVTSPTTCTCTSNTVPVRCNCCNKGYHEKCSTGPKVSSRDINGNFNKCAKILQHSSSANISQLPAPTNTIPSQQLLTQSMDKLTNIQMERLCNRLINLDIDIVKLNSKLQKVYKTPLIEG